MGRYGSVLGTGSDSGSWMDLGEVEEDIMSVGTPRSDQFQVSHWKAFV